MQQKTSLWNRFQGSFGMQGDIFVSPKIYDFSKVNSFSAALAAFPGSFYLLL